MRLRGQVELPVQWTASVALDGWSAGGSPYLELCSVGVKEKPQSDRSENNDHLSDSSSRPK